MAAAPKPSPISPQFALMAAEMILSSLEREKQTTKKVIAAIPEAGRDYRPDPKARSAYELAWHIAYEDVQFLKGIAQMKIEMAPAKEPPVTIGEIASWYEQNLPAAIQQVRAMSAEKLLTPVDFFGVMKLPVFQYLPMVISHSIHHRGQLSTYLRPMGSKVPSIYGGSADEPFEG